MKRYSHIKEKAEQLRKRGYSLNDICAMLNRCKGTVYYWIKDIKIEKMNAFLKRNNLKVKKSCIEASKATKRKFDRIHKQFSEEAINAWVQRLRDDTNFITFLMSYLCEGDRKDKYRVGICNSDPRFIKYCYEWMKTLNIHKKALYFKVQTHVDQKDSDIADFWKDTLGISSIEIVKKSNSGKMRKRNWNSKYGVLSIFFTDAYVKTMVNTWLELLKEKLPNLYPTSSINIKKIDRGLSPSITQKERL